MICRTLGAVGCGCVALVVGIALAIVFLIYASTDPGPPIEGFMLIAALATIALDRTLGVPSRLRTSRD